MRRTIENVLVDTGAELSWVPPEVLESLGVERVDPELKVLVDAGPAPAALATV